MNSICAAVLVLAIFGALAEAFVNPACTGVTHYGNSYGNGCGATVCDTCQCVKTVLRPPVFEQMPYSCRRCVQVPQLNPCLYPVNPVCHYPGVNALGTTSGCCNTFSPCDSNLFCQTL